MERYDVVVVGAGPAGSTAARRCALGGLKTLIVEKEKLTRDKPCAGGVSRAAVDALGFTLPEALVERRCRGMRVSLGNLRNQVRCDATVAYMVRRSAFDAYLAGKAVEAGAVLHEKRACVSVEKGGNGAVAKTESGDVRANVVIGADGFHGRVARSVRPAFGAEETRFCLISEIPLGETKVSELFDDMVELHFGLVEKGYAWLFPKRDSVSAGVGGVTGDARSLIGSFKRFLMERGLGDGGKVHGCFLPVTRFTHTSHTDGILLCGDAAGFVDSFSGEGIRFAVMSGALAARTALECHERGLFDSGALSGYETACMDAFGRDLLSSVKLTDLLFCRKGLFLGTAVASDRVLRAYIGTLTGETSFADFAGWVKARFPLFLLGRVFSGLTRSRS